MLSPRPIDSEVIAGRPLFADVSKLFTRTEVSCNVLELGRRVGRKILPPGLHDKIGSGAELVLQSVGVLARLLIRMCGIRQQCGRQHSQTEASRTIRETSLHVETPFGIPAP